MNPPKTNITVIVDYYFPSVRGGGPKKSVFLLQDLLKDKIKFNILSYNKDVDGMKYDPKNLIFDVSYISHPLKVFFLLNKDTIYLNSFFSKISIAILFFSRFLSSKKIIVAPRGELFYDNIIKNNTFLKKTAIFLIKFLSKSGLIIHVTSDSERYAAKQILGNKFQYVNIPNLISLDFNSNYEKVFDFSFVGRVIYKKGLLLFLNQLKTIEKSLRINLCVIVEDLKYWEQCLISIENLSHHSIEINLNADESLVKEKLSKSTFTIVPSVNENHGHVIFEALENNSLPIISTGCPFSKEISNNFLKFDVNSDFKANILELMCWENNYIELELLKLQKRVKIIFDKKRLKSKYINLFNK